MNQTEQNDRLFGIGPFALLLFTALLFRFPGVFAVSEVFALRDFPAFGLPICDYLGWSLLHGELPLWNPYSNCGVPFAAQWNTMVYYPPHWIAAITSSAASLSLFCLFHLFAAGLGMHRLARNLTGSDLAASLAGASYALHGLLVNSLMWPNNIAALAWFPFLALATLNAHRQGGANVLVAGLIGGLQMLTGAPEVILFSWVMVALMVAADSNAIKTPPILALRRVAAVGLLTAGLAAVQLLPFLELLTHSERWNANGTSGWAAGPAAWLRWVAPLFDTFATPAGPRFHAEQSWTHSVYGGLLPLLVAGAAIRGHRSRLALALVATAILSGICSLGDQGGLFGLLADWLPLRFPVKFLIFQSFAFPLLAALGTTGFFAREDEKQPVRFALIPGVILTGILCLVVAISLPGLSPERQEPAVESLLSRVILAGIMIALLFAGGRLKTRSATRLAIGAALLAVVITDLTSHQRHLAPSVPKSIADEPAANPFTTAPGNALPDSRATLTARASFQTLYEVTPSMATGWQSGRRGLGANHNLRGRIPKTGGFFSMNPGAVSLLEDSMYAGPNGLHLGILDLLAVSHVMTYTNVFAWVKNPRPGSLIRIGAPPKYLDADETLAAMREPDYTPRDAVFIPRPLQTFITAEADPDANASDPEFTPHRIAFETTTARPTLAAISQTWYPCWRATIDGEDTDLWPANHAFMAIEVPAGRHHVEIIYEDSTFEIGRAVSCTTLLAIIIALWRARRGPDPGSRGDASQPDQTD